MPLVLDAAVPGCDAYVWSLPPVEPGVVRSWSYQNSMRSFQWRDGGIVKSRVAFASHRTPDSFFALLEAGASKGVLRPSSYSSFFHDRFHSPRPSGAARRAMGWLVPGGWEALLLPRGDYEGKWYRYDLRSAYLWALGAGLPDPTTYRHTDKFDKQYDGCYVIHCLPTPGAPYPYDRGGLWPVLRDEIELYGIRGRVLYGVTWSQMFPVDAMLKAIFDWPFWKEVGRAYWGRWAATAPLECATYDTDGVRVKTWQMPATHCNPIWAHVILSRVRARLYEATRNARVARVYVDNVIVDRPLPEGDGLGSWRLEHEYGGLRISNLHRITSIGELPL